MRTTLGYPGGGHVDAAVAFGFDASSAHAGSSGLPSSNPYTWTHTPVGIPKGIVVFTITDNSAVTRVTSITYGGVTMTAMSPSPLVSAGPELGCVITGHTLVSGVPSGAQTVSITLTQITGYGSINVAAISLVGPNDTAVEDTSVSDNVVGANPTCALTIANSSFVCGACITGHDTNAEVAIASGFTEILQVDVGGQNANFGYKNALTSSNTSISWVAASKPYSILAASIKST